MFPIYILEKKNIHLHFKRNNANEDISRFVLIFQDFVDLQEKEHLKTV